VLALGLLAWWFWSLSLRPLATPDEGRYGGIAIDMVRSGDWLVPRLAGLPFFHKPPLFYWLDALAITLLGGGGGAAAVRVASALGAWLACLGVGWHATRVLGLRAGLAAVMVLASQPLFFMAGQYANLDMLVASMITLTVVCWAEAMHAASRRWAVAGWLACALAVLAKGLIGLVLPVLIIAPATWLLYRDAPLRALRRWLAPGGLLAFVVLVSPWFVAMSLRYPGFLDYFFIEQHLRRYTGAQFNNPRPFWFFVAVLALLMLPWSLLLPGGIRNAWVAWRAYPLNRRTAHVIWWLWWGSGVLLCFSVPRSKLVGYILPAVPALALLIGAWWATWPTGRMRWTLPALGLACCLGALLVGVRMSPGLHAIGPAIAAAGRADPAWRLAPVVHCQRWWADVQVGSTSLVLPWIVSDWDDPQIALNDDWRKELSDAARFEPAVARQVLHQWDHLHAALLQQPRAWLLVQDQVVQHEPWLAALPVVVRDGAWLLLRWQQPAGPRHHDPF
jgi:4-amino-4-deoxy-L-arabinose transferase-like glycosyltransferase